jgi:hypothetical protein
VNYITVIENRTRMGFAIDTARGRWLDTTFIPQYYGFKNAYTN